MKTALIFIRHSLPEIDSRIPASQWSLSQVGKQRCRTLAEKLVRYLPFWLYSSPELKAIQTTQEISREVSLPFQIIEGLEEHKRGAGSLATRQVFEDRVQDFFSNPDKLVFGMETADQSYRRFNDTIEQVIHLSGESPAIVSHGTVISLFIARHCGVDAFTFWKNLGLPCFVVLGLPQMNLIEHIEVL